MALDGFRNVDDERRESGKEEIGTETIIMPLHATTIILLIQRATGMFANAGVLTVEADRLLDGATPQSVKTPFTTHPTIWPPDPNEPDPYEDHYRRRS